MLVNFNQVLSSINLKKLYLFIGLNVLQDIYIGKRKNLRYVLKEKSATLIANFFKYTKGIMLKKNDEEMKILAHNFDNSFKVF